MAAKLERGVADVRGTDWADSELLEEIVLANTSK
jgi:hypothetical protein